MSQIITLQPGQEVTIRAAASSGQPPIEQPPIEQPPIEQPPTIPPRVHVYDMPWGNSGNIPMENLPKGDTLAIKTVTGSKSSSGSLPFFSVAEFDSAPRTRKAVLSYTPGDFDNPIGGAPGATMEGKSLKSLFALGTGSGAGYYPVVPLNTTIYLNVITVDESGDLSRQMFASLSVNQL